MTSFCESLMGGEKIDKKISNKMANSDRIPSNFSSSLFSSLIVLCLTSSLLELPNQSKRLVSEFKLLRSGI